MVRRAKLEEADNHEKRAVELADQDDIDSVSRALLCNMWAIRHTLNKLRNLGINVDEYRGRAGSEKVKSYKRERAINHGPATTQGQLKRQKLLQEKEEETLKEVTLESGEVVPKQLQAPSKYWRLEDMTATFLSQMCCPSSSLPLVLKPI